MYGIINKLLFTPYLTILLKKTIFCTLITFKDSIVNYLTNYILRPKTSMFVLYEYFYAV